MQFNKSFTSAHRTVVAILTATVLVGSQVPARAQQITTNSSGTTICILSFCVTFPSWPPVSPPPTGGGTVRPVPIPALGIGLVGLGMGLARKRRQMAQKPELSTEEVGSAQ